MKSILLIGIGRFGKHIAMQLNAMDHQVMAVDHNEEKINEISHLATEQFAGFDKFVSRHHGEITE